MNFENFYKKYLIGLEPFHRHGLEGRNTISQYLQKLWYQSLERGYKHYNLLRGRKMKNYKIGYTTGVYDMFHIGHLNILKRAKEQCDYLIVGVSTDEVVKSYKNKTPIIPFEERIAIVQELKCVDKAVPQKNMNKMEAWKNLHFDALFHGSDWKGSDMYNKMIDEFSLVGVDVVFLPHTEGVSSTLLSEVLHKMNCEN